MKTKLSKEFLLEEQKEYLKKQIIRGIILSALLLITSVFTLITLLIFGLSCAMETELTPFNTFFDPLLFGVFSVILLFKLADELYEIFVSCFFIRQIKKNNYTIRTIHTTHTVGEWYEISCNEKLLAIYSGASYEL